MRPSPAAGSVFGVDLPLPVHANEARALGMAFVHQNLALIPSLSVTENLRLSQLASAADWRISWRAHYSKRRTPALCPKKKPCLAGLF